MRPLQSDDVMILEPFPFGFQTFSLAGLGAGITEAILVNPFEVVKVTMQVNRAQSKDAPSTWKVTREIVRTQVGKSHWF